MALPDLSEERPVCDPEAPNPNPVEAGPAVAPKDENGKFDPTKIADVSDFGDWEEQGVQRVIPHDKRTLCIVRSVPFLFYSPYAIFVSLSLSVTVTPPR